MKLISNIDKNSPDQSVFTVEREANETVFHQHSVDFPYRLSCGELFLPEGIEVIKPSALYGTNFHTVHFPKSLKTLEAHIFTAEHYAKKTSIIYPGTAEEFKAIAAIMKEEVLESDGFDRYPYYSGGSRWVTYYRCFDNRASDIEVICADGITLLYGAQNRKDDEEPKVKQS